MYNRKIFKVPVSRSFFFFFFLLRLNRNYLNGVDYHVLLSFFFPIEFSNKRRILIIGCGVYC